jgi:quercetin dioxygenase-like cupin family protein
MSHSSRTEHISTVNGFRDLDVSAPTQLREFVSASCGARGISSGAALLGPNSELAYHRHSFSEAVVLLEGQAIFTVEGRRYLLSPLDTIHLPAGVAHRVQNPSAASRFIAYWAFATDVPSREPVPNRYPSEDRLSSDPTPDHPEHIMRFDQAPKYELSEGAIFTDLFGSKFGAVGICGGYGKFAPGSSLPCHSHDYDESITIVAGKAVCQVKGKEYELSGCDTALVPTGRPHRFINRSNEPMAMIWLYGGGEPQRTVLQAGSCEGGALIWPAEKA